MSKKIGKFNIVDLIIIVVVVAAVAVVGFKMLRPTVNTGGKNQPITIKLLVEETPNYAAEAAQVGDKVYDEVKNVTLGVVETIQINDCIAYANNSEGKFIKGGKDGYNSMEIVCRAEGVMNDNGVTIGVTNYGIGHSFTFYAGKAKLYGKVAAIIGE